jgi:hypothetical protein
MTDATIQIGNQVIEVDLVVRGRNHDTSTPCQNGEER